MNTRSDLRHPQYTPILPLSSDVIAQIKSSTTIADLRGVIFGLLENSLDAQASRINVTVDFRRGACIVEDNGLGILPSEFREGGGLGRMYHTSKSSETTSSKVHSAHGTFLASLAALSLLTVTSHHHGHYSHNSLSFHRTKVLSRQTPVPPQNEIRGMPSGTRVIVRDLFGDMPVRVKRRAVMADEHLEREKQWQHLKRGIVSLLLPWRHPVTVSISDAENSSQTLTIASNMSLISNALSERNVGSLQRNASDFDVQNIMSVLIQAGMTTHQSQHDWVLASASACSISVKGTVCLEPAPSKACQFISIGVNPCSHDSGHHDLYEAINNVFSLSSFGQFQEESTPDEAELERRRHDRRFKRDGLTNKQIRSGRKGVDRWPKFYFHIELEQQPSNINPKTPNDATLKRVIDVLEALVSEWLDAHHFRPRKRRRKQADGVSYSAQPNNSVVADSPNVSTDCTVHSRESSLSLTSNTERARPRQITAGARRTEFSPNATRPRTETGHRVSPHPFARWSRIKSGNSLHYDDMWKCNSSSTKIETTPTTPISAPTGVAVRSAARELSTNTTQAVKESDSNTATDGVQTSTLDLSGSGPNDSITWRDPVSRRQHLLDNRTGMEMQRQLRRSKSDGSVSAQSVNTLAVQRSNLCQPLALSRRRSTSLVDQPSSWLSNLFAEWKNPVFLHQTEREIVAVGYGPPGGELGEGRHKCSDHTVTDTFQHPGIAWASQLSKDALAKAEVVAQVDRKFILLKMSNDTNKPSEKQLLVFVDQHAASERCLLERLLADLCRPERSGSQTCTSKLGLTSRVQTVRLDQALHFQISESELPMFRRCAAHFADWGILYDLSAPSEAKPTARRSSIEGRLTVFTLPHGISERCRVEPKLVIELLRSEIYALDESTTARRLPQAPTAVDVQDGDSEAHENHWLRRMGTCPRGILDLLNSRACRSAIMFNDELSIEECTVLVGRLAECVFPFMCAHGRVSMVPLVHLGGEEQTGAVGGDGGAFAGLVEEQGRKKSEVSFAKAFKRWRAGGEICR